MAFMAAGAESGSEDDDLEFEEVLNNPDLDSNAPTKRKPVDESEQQQEQPEGLEIVLENGKTVTKKGKPKYVRCTSMD